jgi:hypothetical protein
MQNFIKVYRIASWSAFNGFVRLRSALEIFSCCTIMRPPTKLQVFANIWPPQNCYNPLSPPILFRFVSARLFSVLQVENEVNFTDAAEIQEAVTGELKKVQQNKFSAAFQKLYDRAKACITRICQLSLFWIKSYVFLMYLRIKKKSVLKLQNALCKHLWAIKG